MKLLLSITLSACFLVQNISKTIIVINYEANKDYIAKNLCVNRDEPESCCEGKCELKKQLDRENKNEAAPESQNKLKIGKSEYCNTGFKISLIENHKETIYFDYLLKPLPGFHSKNDRPPCRRRTVG